jgi:hypothetical protein
MKAITSALVLWSAVTLVSPLAWAKGVTVRITIAGDNLDVPIEINDPGVVSQFNIWNGPGVSTIGPDGTPNPPAYLNPDHSAGRFINWPRGFAEARPSGLQRLEVTFFIGAPRHPDVTRTFLVAYEVDWQNESGYVYLPRWQNSQLIHHGVEGNWFHSSRRWNELIMPMIAERAGSSTALNIQTASGCIIRTRLEADGTIELILLDDDGSQRGRFRYDAASKSYDSLRERMGDLQVGDEVSVSCWPPRS